MRSHILRKRPWLKMKVAAIDFPKEKHPSATSSLAINVRNSRTAKKRLQVKSSGEREAEQKLLFCERAQQRRWSPMHCWVKKAKNRSSGDVTCHRHCCCQSSNGKRAWDQNSLLFVRTGVESEGWRANLTGDHSPTQLTPNAFSDPALSWEAAPRSPHRSWVCAFSDDFARQVPTVLLIKVGSSRDASFKVTEESRARSDFEAECWETSIARKNNN